MTLQLDERQRAMLLEMGVQVWAPATPAPALTAPSAVETVPAQRRVVQVTSPDKVRAPVVARDSNSSGEVQSLQTLGWPELAAAAASCRACGLCAGRKKSTLQPAMSSSGVWMMVGDPPEEDDDRAGAAFAGEAGILLDNMLRAVKATRAGVLRDGESAAYVTHVVKCRPPQGQVPQDADIVQCASYLDREIDLVQPRILFAMGRFAIAALLKEHPQALAQPLGRQRGTIYRYRGIPVVVSYAPQALIRNGADKAKAWADLCLAMDQIEGRLPTMPA